MIRTKIEKKNVFLNIFFSMKIHRSPTPAPFGSDSPRNCCLLGGFCRASHLKFSVYAFICRNLTGNSEFRTDDVGIRFSRVQLTEYTTMRGTIAGHTSTRVQRFCEAQREPGSRKFSVHTRTHRGMNINRQLYNSR